MIMRHSFGKCCLMIMAMPPDPSSGLSAFCECIGASHRWASTGPGPCKTGGSVLWRQTGVPGISERLPGERGSEKSSDVEIQGHVHDGCDSRKCGVG